jgi:hypothetical protein
MAIPQSGAAIPKIDAVGDARSRRSEAIVAATRTPAAIAR